MTKECQARRAVTVRVATEDSHINEARPDDRSDGDRTLSGEKFDWDLSNAEEVSELLISPFLKYRQDTVGVKSD